VLPRHASTSIGAAAILAGLSVAAASSAVGHGLSPKDESHPTFLHDGRARSTEEAILWHSGEAAREKRNFMNLGPRAREALLHWLETL
jgi:CxxC motif-containing protein (DUF1111 family)